MIFKKKDHRRSRRPIEGLTGQLPLKRLGSSFVVEIFKQPLTKKSVGFLRN